MSWTWKETIIVILAQANGHPRHYEDIARQIERSGIKRHRNDHVTKTVNRIITRSMKLEGSASPFVRKAPGVYGLRPDFPLEEFLSDLQRR